MRTRQPQQIACQQVLLEDNSVFSIQWTDLPAEISANVTAGFVLERYLAAIKRMTFGVIQPVNHGAEPAFMFLGKIPLLRFLQPVICTVADGEGIAMRISGGYLVQKAQCHRGEMLVSTKSMPDGSLRVTLRLSDYCPMLLGSSRPSVTRKLLYRITQAAIHKIVTVRFLAILYKELGGAAKQIKTSYIRVVDGENT